MGWVGRDGVADCSAVGVVSGRVDGDPVGTAGCAPDTTCQGTDADGIVGQNIAIICVGRA